MHQIFRRARTLALVAGVSALSVLFAADGAPLVPTAGATSGISGGGSADRAAAAGAAGAPVAGTVPSPGGASAESGVAEKTSGSARKKTTKAKKRRSSRKSSRARARSLPWQKRLGFKWPVNGWITSNFGRRGRSFHHGIDIACPKHKPIRTITRGTVIFVKRLSIYGKTVVVRHPDGYSTLYAHMNQVNVRPGERLGPREMVGRCGSTGHSTGNHLHFELRRNGKFLRPMKYLP